MRTFWAYLCMELKRAWKILQKSIAGFCLLLIFTGTTAILFSVMMQNAQVFQKVSVGISIPEEETISRLTTNYISTMDSVKSICEFQYMDEGRAVEQLKNGNLQAVIVLPEGFFHDVQVGENPPAQIYFPKGKEIPVDIFEELLSAGVSFLQTSESGVYAMLETASYYGAQMSAEDIGNTIALLFANQILARQKMFVSEMHSPLGNYAVVTYYYLAGIVVFLMMCGIPFGFLYEKKQKTLQEKLRIYGIKGLKLSLVKISVMTVYLYVAAMVLYAVGYLLSEKLGYYELVWYPGGCLGMAFLCLAIAVYIHVIYELAYRGNQAPVLLFVINSIAAVGTGVLIPEEYLGTILRGIGKILPMQYWNQFCADVLTGKWNWNIFFLISIHIVIGIIIGVVFLWRNSFVFTDYN